VGSDARYLLQVSELLERIVRNRKMGVIVVSVVLNFTKRQIQQLQRPRHFGFQYQGTKDVDCLSAEPVDRGAGLWMIQSIFSDQLSIPYVPRCPGHSILLLR